VIVVKNRQSGEMKKVQGPKTVHDLLRELNLVEGSVLVMRQGDLLTRDTRLEDGDTVEIIPVISGGYM
jgi:sulfur carrier protein ThiS